MVAGWTTTPGQPLKQARAFSSYFWDVIPGNSAMNLFFASRFSQRPQRVFAFPVRLFLLPSFSKSLSGRSPRGSRRGIKEDFMGGHFSHAAKREANDVLPMIY
jgi:hypothetical protein